MNHRRTAGLAVLVLLALTACSPRSEPVAAPTSEPASASAAATPTDQGAGEDVVPDVVGLLAARATAVLDGLDVEVQYKAIADWAEATSSDAAGLPVVSTYPEVGQPIGAGRLVVLFVDPGADPALPDYDLSTDAGLCAADADLTSLELNDALAPLLGFPADRDARTLEQDDSIRAHKNAAFGRACPERAS